MIIINWYTFRKYGEDKLRAENGEWRIPEKNLLILRFGLIDLKKNQCQKIIGSFLPININNYKHKKR